ncbi:hypothetical protein F5880DRAFT_1569583 [Lentinula raphanica]|nr:hypothetical protein F5880DRAFT_1569583 [Lentinula raphanica]
MTSKPKPISIDHYFRYALPPLPTTLATKVQDVCVFLLKNETFGDLKKTHNSPQHSLATLFDSVVEAAQLSCPELQPNFRFIVDKAADTLPRPRPDGCFVMSDRLMDDLFRRCEASMKKDGWDAESVTSGTQRCSVNTSLYESATPLVLKRHISTVDVDDDDNVDARLIQNMSEILSVDPSRRFSLGITIEGYSLCLFLLSRETLLKTKPFNIIENHSLLIQVFLAFAFSSPENMGWDPTVTFSHEDSNGRQYNIRVDQHFYRTIRRLCDRSAENPLGRATRVWKVHDAQGKVHVLKDLWLKNDHSEEHEVYEKIVEDVVRSASPDDKAQAKKAVVDRLLTPLNHCRVKADDTKSSGSNSVCVPAHVESKIRQLFSSDNAELWNFHQRKNKDMTPCSLKYHYRIVFQEYATTLLDERNLANTLHAIKGILIALYLIHSAGWIHRDVSGGNLYYYKDRDAGLLGDLEYAKRADEESKQTARVGTPTFMALEAIVGSYLFQRAPVRPPALTTPPDLFSMLNNEWCPPQPISPVKKYSPFARNALHDLESVWWVLVWVLLHNDDAVCPSQDNSARQTLINHAFPKHVNSLTRVSFFKTPDFKNALPSSFSPAVSVVDKFSNMLYAAYERLEEHYPKIEPLIQPLVHLSCIQLFDARLRQSISDVELVFLNIQ